MWDNGKRGGKKISRYFKCMKYSQWDPNKIRRFLVIMSLANSESIVSPCTPQAEMGLVWSEIA